MEAGYGAQALAAPQADEDPVEVDLLVDAGVEGGLDRTDLGRGRVTLGEVPERRRRDLRYPWPNLRHDHRTPVSRAALARGEIKLVESSRAIVRQDH